MFVGTFCTFGTIALLILFDILEDDEKHIGCVDTTEDRCGFTEFSPQGNVFAPSGLGTFVAQ